MNLLLDTHVALWAITDSPKLKQQARELILSPKTTVWVSVASLWEIAIKHSLDRGDMPVSGQNALRYFQASGFLSLAIEAEHALAVETLPAYHQDPFRPPFAGPSVGRADAANDPRCHRGTIQRYHY